ncbi:MAG: TIGR02186 family protein [Acidobacteriota bacterium]
MRPRVLLLVLVLALCGVPAWTQDPGAFVAVHRVNVSLTFSGQDVFLYGRAPKGTTRALAILEGGSAGALRLMEKGRVALFWLGVRQYRLTGVPGIYLVNASCPHCNGLEQCRHSPDLAYWNQVLAPFDTSVGIDHLRAQADLECLSGPLETGEVERTLEGFWTLEELRGLYVVNGNAIRLSAQGGFYHRFFLPTQAPDGRYTITTFFASDDRILSVERNDLFVRKAGLVAWLTRLAERRAFSYGIFTILIAVAAGWTAGTLFKRGGGH